MRTMFTAFAAVPAQAIQDIKKAAGANEQTTTNFVRLIYRSPKT